MCHASSAAASEALLRQAETTNLSVRQISSLNVHLQLLIVRNRPTERTTSTVEMVRSPRPRPPRCHRPDGRSVHLRLQCPLRVRARVSSVPVNPRGSDDLRTAATVMVGLLEVATTMVGLLQPARVFRRPRSAVAAAAVAAAPAALHRSLRPRPVRYAGRRSKRPNTTGEGEDCSLARGPT